MACPNCQHHHARALWPLGREIRVTTRAPRSLDSPSESRDRYSVAGGWAGHAAWRRWTERLHVLGGTQQGGARFKVWMV